MKFPGILKDTPVLTGAFLSRPWLDWVQTLGTPTPSVVLSSAADRANHPAARVALGSRMIVQEWDVTYEARMAGGQQLWRYAYGTFRAVLASKPGLGANDVGFLFYATDYWRLFRWTGTAWEYGPGEPPTRAIILYPGTLPTGYALCDGSAVTLTAADATTGSFTTPDLTGQYLKGGVYTGSVVAATRTSSDSAGTPAGTNDAPAFTGTPATFSSRTDLQTGGAASATTQTSYTPAGTVAAPVFSGTALAAHDHTAGEQAHALLLPVVKL